MQTKALQNKQNHSPNVKDQFCNVLSIFILLLQSGVLEYQARLQLSSASLHNNQNYQRYLIEWIKK